MIDSATREIELPEAKLESSGDRIRGWISRLKDLVPKKPSKVISALAHPTVLLPETLPEQDQTTNFSEPTLQNDYSQEGVEESVILDNQDETMQTSEVSGQALKSPVEIMDSLGLTEAIETGHPVIISNSLDCFPDNLKIGRTDQSNDVADWWKFIKSKASRWNTMVCRLPSGDIKITFDFPREDLIQEENGILVDTRFATIGTNLPETSSTQTDNTFSLLSEQEEPLIGEDFASLEYPPRAIPISGIQLNTKSTDSGWEIFDPNDFDWYANLPDQDDDHIIRGMEDEEMIASLETGVIQSRGDVVNDVGQKTGDRAWTFFFPGSCLSGSFGYAAEGRIFNMATFSKPSYVISMKRTENIKVSPGDLYSDEPLPIDGIERIYEIRPVATQGNLAINVNRGENSYLGIHYFLGTVLGGRLLGGMDCPQVIYAFKQVSIEEVRNSLAINTGVK